MNGEASDAGGPAAANAVDAERHVAVAEVARPHGIRGELRLRMFNEGSDILLGKPSIQLRLADGTVRAASIGSVRRTNKAVLVELRGVIDRDGADALRGARVEVRRDALPPVEEGEFYACDLEGARVFLGEREVGSVKTVIEYPSCDVLVVDRGAEGLALEVPLVEAYVASVDVEGGRVELVTLEGLA